MHFPCKSSSAVHFTWALLGISLRYDRYSTQTVDPNFVYLVYWINCYVDYLLVFAREFLKRESRDWSYTTTEIADVRKNQNRYCTFAMTHIEQVPAPLGSVKATNSETTSRRGTSFLGLCNEASHACCVLQASSPLIKARLIWRIQEILLRVGT